MSRAYRVDVEIKSDKISLEELGNIMSVEFGWEENDAGEHNWIKYFEGEGKLCGGKGEEEAHKEINNFIIGRDSEAKVFTRCTYLDEIPYNDYGSLD